ncbi:MAG: hypothetical protein ACKVWV_01955 [Planctomycetota bacterium]
MKNHRLLVFAIAVLGAACSSGSSGGGTDFDAFVTDVVQSTADDTEPVQVNDKSFAFSEDPNAFDDLFQ